MSSYNVFRSSSKFPWLVKVKLNEGEIANVFLIPLPGSPWLTLLLAPHSGVTLSSIVAIVPHPCHLFEVPRPPALLPSYTTTIDIRVVLLLLLVTKLMLPAQDQFKQDQTGGGNFER